MSNQIGRISGPLLSENLLRNGVDLAFETDLLYLEVSDERIGIKTDSPSRLLNIETAVKTIDIIVDNTIDAANLNFDNESNITTDIDKLFIDSLENINIPSIKVDNLRFDNNQIFSLINNADIELVPTGKTIFGSNTHITGNMHATGDITLGGNIILGNSNEDNVIFSSDINSDKVPDEDAVYNLGDANKRWRDLYVKSIVNNLIFVDNLIVAEDINYNLRFSNAYFVSTTGSNSNRGNHQNAPYRNISYALTKAEAGDTVFVYPGTYTEIFPLTVPAGVSIVGFDIRTTIVKPTELTKDKDAFLLNGETTITDLTVKDFEFDLDNNTGYAFRFANNFKVTTRSPYIQNITVITKGNNPGKGSLIDGSVANIDSKEASMLFHSVTFITPGVDALTMTNGVRVEWLNSFTYFADRGLYAIDGSLGFASQGTRFGAEIRSIGSANVYGNYGAVADGGSTLMYLINHNFGYVGSGLNSSNDNTLVIQENETVELDGGKIYYTSQAQNGDFRVGDEFHVDFLQGRVNFDTTGLALDGVSTIFFQGSIDRTFLEAGRIETGDFLLENNKIKTLTSDFNLLSASNEIIFLQNVNINKNIFIRDNVTVSGNVFLGNEPFDKITINTNFSQNLYPKIDDEYTLGTNARRWRDFYVDTVNLQDIRIEDNQIFTTVEDSDLIFVGNTDGGVKLQDLLFKNSTISSYNNRNIILTPNTDKSLVIFGTGAFRIPRTVTTLNLTGDLRFNTSSNQYEGYSSALLTLGGIYSSDRRTSVLAHPTNNTFIFTTNNIVNTTLSNSTLNTVRFETGTLVFDNNAITSTTGDISLVGDKTTLGQIIFEDHTISALENQNINLITTNQGYVQFAGEKALVIPSGTLSERPADPILGSTRYNSELGFMETWNGSNWQSVAGEGDLADFEYTNESTTIWSLVVG